MHIVPAVICESYWFYAVGSKVTDLVPFDRILESAVAAHDFTKDRVPGQGFIALPEAIPYVSCGVGRPSQDPNHYTLKLYRGKVSAFLKREYAAPVESCHAVVYTKDAYMNDPDVTDKEAGRICTWLPCYGIKATHVLVALLASAGPKSQLGPYRFTANLAGGNHEAQLWTAEEIRDKARAIMAYEREWVTVTDAED